MDFLATVDYQRKIIWERIGSQPAMIQPPAARTARAVSQSKSRIVKRNRMVRSIWSQC